MAEWNTATDNLKSNPYELEQQPILLPCPFCGCKTPELSNLVDEDDYFVSCPDCEVQQIANYTPRRAIERWNRRVAGPDVLSQKNSTGGTRGN